MKTTRRTPLFSRGCERAVLLLSRVAMWLTVLVVSVMIYEVVLRYLFEKPTLWANELSLWTAGILYLFAGLYAMRERAHIRVTIFYERFSLRVRRVLDVIAMLVVVVFAVLVVVGSWESVLGTVMRWERFGTAWDPPLPATVKPLILIAAVLIAVQAVSNFFADFYKAKPGPPEENPDEMIAGAVDQDAAAAARMAAGAVGAAQPKQPNP